VKRTLFGFERNPNAPVERVGDDDESAINGQRESHVWIHDLVSPASAQRRPHLIPSGFLSHGPHDVSLFHHRPRPCAVPRRSRRERQDRRQSAGRHAKQPTTTLRLNSRSYVYSPSSSLASFTRLLTTLTRIPVFASQPRAIIPKLTTRLRRRCEFSRFRRPRINNSSRKHRLASLRTNESELKGRQSTILFPHLLSTPSILCSTPP